jgi:hypothetical protein
MAFDPITAVAQLSNTVLSRVLPDKAAQEAASAQLAQMQLSGEIQSIAGQIGVDADEAENKSVFVAGWRPAIGWVCAMALFYDFIFRPLLNFAAGVVQIKTVAGEIDMGSLSVLLTGMLGFGAMRTVEKVQGVSGDTKNSGH